MARKHPPSKTNVNPTTPRCIILKLQKTKDKEKYLKEIINPNILPSVLGESPTYLNLHLSFSSSKEAEEILYVSQLNTSYLPLGIREPISREEFNSEFY